MSPVEDVWALSYVFVLISFFKKITNCDFQFRIYTTGSGRGSTSHRDAALDKPQKLSPTIQAMFIS
jgi:hypothetical protein